MNQSEESDVDDIDSEIIGSQVPRYLLKPSPLDHFTIDFRNILANIKEDGDGGDSDIDRDVAVDLDVAVKEANKEINEFNDDENELLLLDDNFTVFPSTVDMKPFTTVNFLGEMLDPIVV